MGMSVGSCGGERTRWERSDKTTGGREEADVEKTERRAATSSARAVGVDKPNKRINKKKESMEDTGAVWGRG
jgi:hypothetical protein